MEYSFAESDGYTILVPVITRLAGGENQAVSYPDPLYRDITASL